MVSARAETATTSAKSPMNAESRFIFIAISTPLISRGNPKGISSQVKSNLIATQVVEGGNFYLIVPNHLTGIDVNSYLSHEAQNGRRMRTFGECFAHG